MQFSASAPPTVVAITLTVSGPGMATATFAFPVDSTGKASGTITVPAGSERVIVGRAFDSSGVNTHEGDTTVTLVPGPNPPLMLVLRPLAGTLPIVVTFGSYSVTLTPGDSTIQPGATVLYTAVVTDEKGDTVPGAQVTWGSSNPVVVSVDSTGLAAGHLPGNTMVSAIYGGASASVIVTVEGTTNRIVFASDSSGDSDIYVMNVDGSGAIDLTNTVGADLSPVWSPDRSHIVWYATRSGNTDVYVMASDGTGVTRLTTNPGADAHPVWSPDGKSIAYQCEEEICTMNADGTNIVQLTTTTAPNQYPSWSPNGAKIAFESTRDGNFQIYEMNVDGTGETRLGVTTSNDRAPAWSPDGSKIAFVSDRDGNDEIYAMNADGSNPVRLTNNAGSDEAPRWSADGLRIAWTSNRTGNLEIYMMNADGSGVTQLTHTVGNSFAPDP